MIPIVETCFAAMGLDGKDGPLVEADSLSLSVAADWCMDQSGRGWSERAEWLRAVAGQLTQLPDTIAVGSRPTAQWGTPEWSDRSFGGQSFRDGPDDRAGVIEDDDLGGVRSFCLTMIRLEDWWLVHPSRRRALRNYHDSPFCRPRQTEASYPVACLLATIGETPCFYMQASHKDAPRPRRFLMSFPARPVLSAYAYWSRINPISEINFVVGRMGMLIDGDLGLPMGASRSLRGDSCLAIFGTSNHAFNTKITFIK